MEPGYNSNIGILFDHPDYVEQFRKYSGLNLIPLPLTLTFSVYSRALKVFKYKSNAIDYIIIYSAIKHNTHRKNYGLEWIRSFRLAGYNTPIILLTWITEKKVESFHSAKNPFLLRDKSKSIQILRLPVRLYEINDTLNILSPLSDEQFEQYTLLIEDYEKIKIKHDLGSKSISNIKEAISKTKSLQEEYSFYGDYSNLFNALLACSTLEQFRVIIETYN